MTSHERKRLLEAYSEYVNGRFNELTGFIVLVVGFGLGTLSAQKIPPEFNLGTMAIVLSIFVGLMLKEKWASDSELKQMLSKLEQKYEKKDNNQEIMDEIRSYDIWNSFSGRVVKHNLPLVFSILFGIYTLVEHSAKVFELW